ncbi:unnamed protein product [Amoebophrya sp. A120]|nr:unnamed protein product [Amoebophrya sp. A120]|eukprot:GSA120T00012061001.1
MVISTSHDAVFLRYVFDKKEKYDHTILGSSSTACSIDDDELESLTTGLSSRSSQPRSPPRRVEILTHGGAAGASTKLNNSKTYENSSAGGDRAAGSSHCHPLLFGFRHDPWKKVTFFCRATWIKTGCDFITRQCQGSQVDRDARAFFCCSERVEFFGVLAGRKIMVLGHELYSPVLQDDFELKNNGGPYHTKFAMLQVTVRLPEYSVVNWIAVAYGFLPFLLSFLLPAFYLVTQRFVYLYGIAIGLACMAISEICLKPLFKDPRPPESANRHPDGSMKYGMPSGHALATVAQMTWVCLEVVCRDLVLGKGDADPNDINFWFLGVTLALCIDLLLVCSCRIRTPEVCLCCCEDSDSVMHRDHDVSCIVKDKRVMDMPVLPEQVQAQGDLEVEQHLFFIRSASPMVARLEQGSHDKPGPHGFRFRPDHRHSGFSVAHEQLPRALVSLGSQRLGYKTDSEVVALECRAGDVEASCKTT